MRGADTSNSIYIDGVRDIGSVTRDTFNTEQVEVIKGPSGTDYGRSAPTGSINMISKQPRTDSGIDASASVGSAWFRRGTLDINQVIGETTAARLNLMGEKHMMPVAIMLRMNVTAWPLTCFWLRHREPTVSELSARYSTQHTGWRHSHHRPAGLLRAFRRDVCTESFRKS